MPNPPINPPSTYAPHEAIDCSACDRPIDEPVVGYPCPFCGCIIEQDWVRDQLEAQAEPEEDRGTER